MAIHTVHGPGLPPALTPGLWVKLLLIKQIAGESNRMLANMLAPYSMLSGIDVSHRTVERLYSDDEVHPGIHKLHMLLPQSITLNTTITPKAV